MNRNLPPRKALRPNPRHLLSRIKEGTRKRRRNSVIDPTVDVAADIAAINRGEAIREGDSYIVNGRRYGMEESGRTYPIDGPGIHRLGRGAYRAFQIYNTHGLTDDAEQMLDLEKIDAAERAAAQRVWRLGQKTD